MSKEKVFIVASHMNSLKKNEKTGKCIAGEWEVQEVVEFVNQLTKKHTTMATAIGDYLNKKMITGARHGMDDYAKFEEYVRTKYSKQMDELDKAYAYQRVQYQEVGAEYLEQITDQFGNVRQKTVFDIA